MIPCYDEGQLRTYLDDALPDENRTVATAHFATCQICRERLDAQRILRSQIQHVLAMPIPASSPQIALDRLRQRVVERPTMDERLRNEAFVAHSADDAQLRRTSMKSLSRLWASPRRPLFTGIMTIVVLLSLLAF